MKINIPEEKKQIYSLIAAGLVVLAIFVIIGVRSASNPSGDFQLNKEGIIEFFVQNIDQLVPGGDWRVSQVRFAISDRSYEGVYVVYENNERSQAFLMLVNPVQSRIDYEIVGTFNVNSDDTLELVAGFDSFAGEEQEIWQVLSETEWERVTD